MFRGANYLDNYILRNQLHPDFLLARTSVYNDNYTEQSGNNQPEANVTNSSMQPDQKNTSNTQNGQGVRKSNCEPYNPQAVYEMRSTDVNTIGQHTNQELRNGEQPALSTANPSRPVHHQQQRTVPRSAPIDIPRTKPVRTHRYNENLNFWG